MTTPSASFIDGAGTPYATAAATFDIPRPTAGGALAVGDVLIANIVWDTAATTPPARTLPTGWTTITGQITVGTGATAIHVEGISHVVTSAEAASPPASWALTNGASYVGSVSVERFRGVNTADLFAVSAPVAGFSSSVDTTTVSTKVAPLVTVDTANAMLVTGSGHRSGSTTLVDVTPSYTVGASVFGASSGRGGGLAHKPQAATGDSTTATWTTSSTSTGATWQTALNPAPDTTAPTVPTGVAAVADSSTQVTVSWAASTDAVGVASYRVRQGGVDVAGATAVTGTSFAVTGLTPSTAYSFTVSAVDAAGNRSAESTAATASTPAAPVIPTAPTPTAPDHVRPPAQWSMFSRAADYSLDLPLRISSVQGVLRHMGVDVVTATTPFTPQAWASLQPSRGLVLWRDGRQEFTGRLTAREITWDAEDGRAAIKVEAKDDRSRLARRLSFPDPLRAADDQTVNDYWMSRTAGAATAKVASTAMLQLLSDQAGATCRVDRQIPGLTLGPDPAVGLSRVWSALFTPVLDQLALMSVASGANLGLRMTSATGALTATVVVPRDLTDSVVFSADLSNLVGFTYREAEPDVTHALAAGQGDLHLRLRKLTVTTDPQALAWGEQSWSYIDRRDTADVAELTKANEDALADGEPTVSLAVQLTDSQAATYGVDWGLGDAITVYVGLPGQTKVAAVSDVCREVAFEVDAKGVERITPAIGSYDAKAVIPTPTQQKIAEVASGLSGLIARK